MDNEKVKYIERLANDVSKTTNLTQRDATIKTLVAEIEGLNDADLGDLSEIITYSLNEYSIVFLVIKQLSVRLQRATQALEVSNKRSKSQGKVLTSEEAEEVRKNLGRTPKE